jgi:predicted CoA-substrate-specific enzyme activase
LANSFIIAFMLSVTPHYYLGIDIGSTTVKSVVLSSEEKLLYSSYRRHNSQVRETLLETLQAVDAAFPGASFALAITGSAGLGLSEKASLPFVQEVSGAFLAVKRFYPQADVVVELGGEDAKIIFLTGGSEERMNGTCAGGTGAFIDQMASLLNVSTTELDALSLNYQQIYPIASRCGVFAKSDIQPLLNQGARKEDVAMSIYYSVVGQTISGLAQGRQIKGNVLFLGGPLSFLQGLRKAFVDSLHLDAKSAIFPEEGKVFMGIGAALFAEKTGKSLTMAEILSKIQNADLSNDLKASDPLFKDDQEYQTFIQSHLNVAVQYAPLPHYVGKCYLGIDAGSTTTKMVLIKRKA